MEKLDAIPAKNHGYSKILLWSLGERGWYTEEDKRHRRVQLYDFESVESNTFDVQFE
jgi:type I restriction enzyme, R subunit